MRIKLHVAALLAAATLLSTPARADWYEAQSDHFIIYADDREKDVRQFAENLERYHSAMEYVTGRDVEKPSPSNRVTIFVVGGKGDMRKLSGSRDIAGFYSPRAGGSKAFVQDIRLRNGYPHFSTVILMHEYAHHYLISSSRFAMPRWMSEGAAEFFAAASFDKDGGVMIGRPAEHRAGDLAVSKNMEVEELFGPEAGMRPNRYDGFYGRAWLLYHFLTFSKERSGQLSEYWMNLAKGQPPMEAAADAFGDLDELDKDLNGYLRQRRMSTFALKPEMTSIGPIALRRLPEGEAEMMPIRIRSQRGVNSEEAGEVLEDAREVAAEYPADPGVLTALAEAEYDVGHDDAAIAAADRAIAIDPGRIHAYVQKGYALFRKAADAEDSDAAYEAAMAPFSALNQLENDHPLPLIYYYRSFAERGLEPVESAKHALERASQLAPFDQSLAMNVAIMQAQEGKTKLAAHTLAPLAANPHGGGLAKSAQQLIAALEQEPDGEPFDFARIAEAMGQDTAGGEGQGETDLTGEGSGDTPDSGD